jgi:hypothetical protein
VACSSSALESRWVGPGNHRAIHALLHALYGLTRGKEPMGPSERQSQRSYPLDAASSLNCVTMYAAQ